MGTEPPGAIERNPSGRSGQWLGRWCGHKINQRNLLAMVFLCCVHRGANHFTAQCGEGGWWNVKREIHGEKFCCGEFCYKKKFSTIKWGELWSNFNDQSGAMEVLGMNIDELIFETLQMAVQSYCLSNSSTCGESCTSPQAIKGLLFGLVSHKFCLESSWRKSI